MFKKSNSEDQQLKLAMARSMQSEDDVDEEYDENEIVELDSQTDYMSKTVLSRVKRVFNGLTRIRSCWTQTPRWTLVASRSCPSRTPYLPRLTTTAVRLIVDTIRPMCWIQRARSGSPSTINEFARFWRKRSKAGRSCVTCFSTWEKSMGCRFATITTSSILHKKQIRTFAQKCGSELSPPPPPQNSQRNVTLIYTCTLPLSPVS